MAPHLIAASDTEQSSVAGITPEEIRALVSEVKSLRSETKELKKEVQVLRTHDFHNSIVTSDAAPAGAGEYASKDDVDGVRSDVQTLRDQLNRSFDQNISGNLRVPTSKRSLTLGGFAQVQGFYSDNSATPAGFRLNNLTISLSGKLKKDYSEGRDVGYYFSISSFNPSYNPKNPGTTDFRIAPLDAYLTYAILPTINPEKPNLSVALGQMQKPFGLEATAGEDTITTINRATFALGSGLNLAARDIGILFTGDLFPHNDFGAGWRVPLIQYSAGCFNGSGYDSFNLNRRIAPAARVVLNAPVDYNSILRGLSVGASYYGGYNVALAPSGASLKKPDGSPETLEASRVGADISWIHTPFGITAEYARGSDAFLKSDDTHGSGYAVTAFFQWGQKFEKLFANQDRFDDWFPQTYQPFVRFESFDNEVNNQQNIYTAGFNWFFAPTTKLQLNYRYVTNTNESLRQHEDQFIAQFQYGF